MRLCGRCFEELQNICQPQSHISPKPYYIVVLSGETDTLITLNNIYRTDLLMARTRLRLGESLACMVYLHRWNCHKHLAFYFIALGLHGHFFFSYGRDTRMGWDGRETEADGHLRITHCQGTLPGLGSRSKGFAKCRLVATYVARFLFIFFFFSIYSGETTLQAKLSLRLDASNINV